VQAPSFICDPKAPYAHPYFWAPFFLMEIGCKCLFKPQMNARSADSEPRPKGAVPSLLPNFQRQLQHHRIARFAVDAVHRPVAPGRPSSAVSRRSRLLFGRWYRLSLPAPAPPLVDFGLPLFLQDSHLVIGELHGSRPIARPAIGLRAYQNRKGSLSDRVGCAVP